MYLSLDLSRLEAFKPFDKKKEFGEFLGFMSVLFFFFSLCRHQYVGIFVWRICKQILKLIKLFHLALIIVPISLILVSCSSTSISIPAPVVDHSSNKAPKEMHQEISKSAANENSSKPGFYTVKPGDTIIRIALDNGQNWRDVANWNNLENPNVIEVGKVLRVIPPDASMNASGVVVRPVNSRNNPSTSTGSMTLIPNEASSTPAQPITSNTPSSTTSSTTASNTVTSNSPNTQSASANSSENSQDMPAFIWPAAGKVVAGFDEVKNKGLDISGKAGDPVFAAAEGKVVYAGSGLRGYGNLIIIKHNNTYLTAYAHNQSLIAKEDQSVKQGQKIAELGNSDAEQFELHFEIRKLGKPVDPIKLLPPR
jgi:lipoprotein NlpD